MATWSEGARNTYTPLRIDATTFAARREALESVGLEA